MADRDKAEERATAGVVARAKDRGPAEDREATHPALAASVCVRTAVPPHRTSAGFRACKRHARGAAAR